MQGAGSVEPAPTGYALVVIIAAGLVKPSRRRVRVCGETLTSAMPTSGISHAWTEGGGTGGHREDTDVSDDVAGDT